jgi:hypothetical protein
VVLLIFAEKVLTAKYKCSAKNGVSNIKYEYALSLRYSDLLINKNTKSNANKGRPKVTISTIDKAKLGDNP